MGGFGARTYTCYYSYAAIWKDMDYRIELEGIAAEMQ